MKSSIFYVEVMNCGFAQYLSLSLWCNWGTMFHFRSLVFCPIANSSTTYKL
jgi:hypothetical protein